MDERRVIPLVPGEDPALARCSDGAPYALMVLGDSMLPEFEEGEVVVVEPGGHAREGAYVIAIHEGEYIFRQLARCDTGWLLHALNPRYPDAPLDDLAAVKGVVIQKRSRGARRERKSYID